MNLSAPETLRLLRDAQYDTLQANLSDPQERFEAGQLKEQVLLDAFKAFIAPDPTFDERFAAWMEAHPGSYAAHTAFAHWFLSRAWAARGEQTSARVSDQGWRGLQHYTEQADACARHATTLTENPLAAWMVIGLSANSRGCTVALQDVQDARYPDWYARPLQDNPHSLALRLLMLRHLRTEWGGSELQMLQFVRQQQDSGLLSDTDMQRLWSEYHVFVSHHALHFASDPGTALERARLATDMRELHAGHLFVVLAATKAPAHETVAALERYLNAAEQEQNAVPVGNFRYALAQNIKGIEPLVPRVMAFLTRAVSQGETDSAEMIGQLKTVHPDWPVPDPLPALRQARDQGSVSAAETIVVLTPRVTPAYREDILKAADLGSATYAWVVYQSFPQYREQFGLEERAKYRYLLRAADLGDDDARVELAQQLRAGQMELGEDGVLRPVDTRPIQQSLDYAKHLLERAAGTGHKPARKLLDRAREKDWQEATAGRITAAKPDAPRRTFGATWWKWMLAVAVLRLLASFFGHHTT